MDRFPRAFKAVFGVLDNPRVELIAGRLLVLLVISSTIVSLVSLEISLSAGQREREGRQIVRQALCGVASGIITAGRTQIESGGEALPQPYERNLERLGLLPSLAARRLAARIGAEAYSRGIAEEAQKTSGRRDLVNPDGTLNCRNLNTVATP